MGSVLIWWLALDIIALLALPITWWLLRALPDRGLILARPAGLLLTGYLFWLLVTLGLLQNTAAGIVLVLLAVGGLSLALARRHWHDLWRDLVSRRAIWLFGEVLFGVALILFCVFRAYNPEIAATEKPMEFGFINAILRSRSFPPNDPWLSGYAISYYYLGYVLVAMVTRLTGLSSAVTFNLAGATLFALTVSGSFSLVYNMAQARQARLTAPGWLMRLPALLAGLLGSTLVALMGNLEGVFEIVRVRGWGSEALWRWLDVKNLRGGPATGQWIPSDQWWWWRASRIIHDRDAAGVSMEVISEFPFFSFLLGDNHPHVLALPFVLLALALALAFWLRQSAAPTREESRWHHWLGQLGLLGPWEILLWGLVLGGLGFVNTWDYPIYLGIMAVVCAMRRYRAHPRGAGWLQDALLLGAALLALGLALYAPFYIGFRSQAGGIGSVGTIKTQWQQYLLMFGIFVVALGGFFAAVGRRWLQARGLWRLPVLGWLVAGATLLTTGLGVYQGWWTAALSAGLAGCAATMLIWGCGASEDALDRGACFALLLAATGLLLTLSVEFVFLRDSFGTRMNTVFKFYYQGWILMGLASAYGVYDLLSRAGRANLWRRGLAGLWGLAVGLLVLCGLCYTVAATVSKANGLQGQPTLDGVRYVARHRPAEHEAIAWLQTHAPQGAVLVEATGGSYTEYNWVSAHTGIPTVLGWGGHELQWRGNYDEPGRREPDIARIYQSTNVEETRDLLDAYGIDYVYLGPLERTKHRPSEAAIAKLDRLMTRAFENEAVTIYARAR
jgi:YYY domain-containing protein